MTTGKTVTSNIQDGLNRFLLFFLFVFSVQGIAAQQDSIRNDSLNQPKKTRIDLLHADFAKGDQKLYPDALILVGNIKLRHDSMYMYCDSAMIYQKTNSFVAYDNVRMEQGDTLFIYGDYLFYDGNSQLAQLRNNVKLINRNNTLTTDSLNYDRVFNLGYYFNGGTLDDQQNILTSDWGEYSPATKMAVFNRDVELTNDRFVLASDTLKYSTISKVATILGPSNIVNEENHIYSERGVYNTINEQAQLLDRSVLTSGSKKLTGDSLFYDRKAAYGQAFENVVMNDTVSKNMLVGDYCYYNEANQSAFATEKAVAIDYSQGDSLYMHADTLRMNTYYLNTDSIYREMLAYHKVRIFRNDIQGVCDSLAFVSKDSCLTMYHNPILWNVEKQIVGEEIKVYMNDSTIDWAHIKNNAFAIEKKDSIHYNQSAGKEMKAFFVDKDLRKIDIIGNVQLIFYPEDEDGTMIGMNRSESSLLNLYLKNQKMIKMIMSPSSNGILYPMDQIPEDKYKLANFMWFDYLRPKNKEDIFIWKKRRKEDFIPKSSRKPVKEAKRELVN